MPKLDLPPRMVPTSDYFTVYKQKNSQIWMAVRGPYEAFWNFVGSGWTPNEAVERLLHKEVTQYVEDEPLVPILPEHSNDGETK